MTTLRKAKDLAPAKSVRTKIRAIVASVLATVIALLGTSLVSLWLLSSDLQDLGNTVGPAYVANASLRQAMTDAESGIRGYQLTNNRAFLAPYTQARTRLRDTDEELRRAVGEDARLSELARQQQRSVERWTRGYAIPVAAKDSGSTTPSSGLSQLEAKAEFDRFRSLNGQLGSRLSSERLDLIARAQLTTRLAVVLLVLVAALGALLGLRPALRALRTVGPPLERLHRTVIKLQSGDNSARADTQTGALEIRSVSTALNAFAETNERRHESLASNLALAAAVRDIGTTITATLDLGAVIDGSIEPVRTAFHAQAAWIRAFEGTGERPGRGRGAISPADPNLVPPEDLVVIGRRIAEHCWDHQLCMTLPGTEASRHAITASEEATILGFIKQINSAKILMAPLGAASECLGYLGITRTAEEPDWTTAETEAALSVGWDIGRAILNARIYEQEQQVVQELQDLDAQKDIFVSTVSHELRTPLASIVGHLDLVRSGALAPVDPALDRSLAAVDRNSQRLSGVIEDLLLLSRIADRPHPSTVIPVDLGDVTRRTFDTLAPQAEPRQIELVLDDKARTQVRGDPSELERVLNNLVGNAIKFSPSAGQVRVIVDTHADAVTLRVRDAGMGISNEDQERLFTRFFRSTNPAAQAVPGTGLGLAIVKIIVERHSGTIDVASELGVGTEFTVTLPLEGPPIAHHAESAPGSTRDSTPLASRAD